MTPNLSFEFFPPKTPEMENKLWQAIEGLSPLAPSFVSVTYGAGGTTRERTHHMVRRIAEETKLVPAAHLTCVGASREEVNQVARDYWQAGIRHIVALRGDQPLGAGSYVPHPQGYRYAADLVAGLRKIGDFEISVAAFPERHPEAKNVEEGIDYLKQKIQAGATRAITQFFFNTQDYFRFVENARAAGVKVPIVPGILPIGNFAQVKKFSALCNATIPDSLAERFIGLEANPERQAQIGVEYATEQCRALLSAGVNHLHFYTLNRADLTSDICRALNIVPVTSAA